MESPVQCHETDLKKARFAKGALASKGLMYTLELASHSNNIQLVPLIHQAILKNAKQMQAPLPFIGVKGIHLLAKRIHGLKNTSKSDQYKKLYLGHIVRMQEEIGTGGAGFRYMYASFLEEASQHLPLTNKQALLDSSNQMTEVGDNWRKFASRTVKLCRNLNSTGYDEVSQLLNNVAELEKACWQNLVKSIKKISY